MKITGSILTALVISGCYNTEKLCEEASNYEATATIGSGYDEFEIYGESETLDPSYGAQGGQHIWGAVQVTGLIPGNGEMVSGSIFGDGSKEASGHDPLSVEFGLSFPDDLIEPYSVSFTDFFSGDIEVSESFGHTVFIDLWDIADTYHEESEIPVEMSVTVEDGCGTIVTDSRPFTLEVESGYYYY
jgi:hypothetical protein